MKRKKGFTLVELLAVIMVLGLVGLIAIPSVTGVLKNSKEKLYNSQVAMIEQSGKKWGIDNINKLSETKKNYLSVSNLITAGYIEQNALIDPRNTKKEMNGCLVIEYNKSYNKYEYNYVDENCRKLNNNRDLTSSDIEYECYNFDTNTGAIISYDKSNPNCSMDVVIPNKIDGVNVRYIEDLAFVTGATKWCHNGTIYVEVGVNDNCNSGWYYDWDEQTQFIKSVEFPEGLIEIGNFSFSFNMLSDVNFDDLINLEYIGYNAFEENQIETVSFYNMPNLEYIEDEAFYGNYISSLKLVDLPLLEYIEEDAFSENNIISLTLQNLGSLNHIYGDAFSNNQINSLNISNLPRLERIGNEAFAYNNLTSVNLTGAPILGRIGWEAFYGNKINSLNLTGLNNLVSIGESAFQDNEIKNLTIPSALTNIEIDAFKGNPIENITMLGDDIYRLNEAWVFIGFPEGLMPVREIVAQPMITLSTSTPNVFPFLNYTYYQTTVPTTGSYRLEVWGAAGNYNGGLGGYSSGRISLNAGDKLYIYVGQAGQPELSAWNGGGSSLGYSYRDNGGGGGATDIRLVPGDWSDNASLYSRIIVAGGGGGGRNTAGYGGGTVGGDCSTVGTGGTQSDGGTGYIGGTSSGSFGKGGWNIKTDDDPGAGGGWYGGGIDRDDGGGGGSGYVLTASSHKPTGYNPLVRFYMTEEQLIAGNASMPNPSGGTMTGRAGNGYARITYLGA